MTKERIKRFIEMTRGREVRGKQENLLR